MDVEHLRRKGWSADELHHARKIITPTALPRDQAVLWLLTILITLGSAALTIFLLPLILFAPSWFTVMVILLLGVLFGLMLVNTLLSLRIIHRHHLKAYLFLLAMSFLILLFISHLLVQYFSAIPGARRMSALLIAGPYLIGLAIPYATERRLHGPA
jgi:hypothetical protein